MAAGDVTISGAYTTTSAGMVGADAFVTAATTAKAGESVFVIPSGGNTFYIGVVEGGG